MEVNNTNGLRFYSVLITLYGFNLVRLNNTISKRISCKLYALLSNFVVGSYPGRRAIMLWYIFLVCIDMY